MSYTKVWIHVVWATRKREPFLNSDLRQKLFNFVKAYSQEKGVQLAAINGHTDHVHCLIQLGKKQTISKVVQLLKGGSSFWLNQEKLTKDKFSWQVGYYAASVSPSKVHVVKKYIEN